MQIDNFIKDNLKTFTPYKLNSYEVKVRMDLNENPYSLPYGLKRKITKKIEKLPFNRYPDPLVLKLRKKLANFLKIDIEKIIIGAGSDDLIQNILLAFSRKKCCVLYPVPTFEMYGIIAKILGLKTEEISLNENFDLKLDDFIKIKERKIIFIAYPNNPTGNCFAKKKIIALLENNTNLIIIDEAYFDFSNKTFLPLIDKYSNLIILRTFSKAFGLAGLRIGYLIAYPKIIETCQRIKLPFNVNSLSQITAGILIDNKAYVDKKIEKILNDREKMYKALKKIKFVFPFKSVANFILFKIKKINANFVFNNLLKKKILVRKFTHPLLKDCLRVTIGKNSENKAFIKVLQDIDKEIE